MDMMLEQIEGSVKLQSMLFSEKSATVVFAYDAPGKEMAITYTTWDTALLKYFRSLQTGRVWKMTLELPEDEHWYLKREQGESGGE